jgi:ribosomal protein L32
VQARSGHDAQMGDPMFDDGAPPAATSEITAALARLKAVDSRLPAKQRREGHKRAGREYFRRELATARACSMCGVRHLALRMAPLDAPCLTCSLAHEAKGGA